ncbi:MAG: thioredoxin domain-containing protein, partial [Actinobacteria bacterium]|nr:thioredoxin domain-containing protein [Actinomycetota bacterium]
ASGGIYDHLGGGFARYSVDRVWLVPHFEKMLYDQAALARVYLPAWQVTGEERYLQVLTETIDYVLRELRQPDGGFSSAEDADSEGEEGKFYVWPYDEFVAAAPEPEVAEWYGVTPEGNFEGANILNRPTRGDLIRPEHIEDARQRLFTERLMRVPPGLDDKVLTERNAMFLSALAEAAAATDYEEWFLAAVGNAEFLLRGLRRDDGRWLRSWQGGRAKHLAFAADYAWLVDAFTRLGEATGEARWIDAARDAADQMLELFWDDQGGGLFTIGSDAEQLIVRAKDLIDGATPSANSVAAVALLRLSALTGEQRYADKAEAIVRLVREPMAQQPTAFTALLAAVDLMVSGVTEIAVVGDVHQHGNVHDLVEAVQSRYLPTAVLAWGEEYASPLWESREPGHAYVCKNYACQQPVTDPDALAAQLG